MVHGLCRVGVLPAASRTGHLLFLSLRFPSRVVRRDFVRVAGAVLLSLLAVRGAV
jgi:hypothetical protein